MMLNFETVVVTGSAALDSGIRDTALKTFNGNTYLYTLSGPGGGVVVWSLLEGAPPQVQDSAYFSANITFQIGRSSVALSFGGEDHLALDINNASGLVSYALNPDGTLGALQESETLPDGGDVSGLAKLTAGSNEFLAVAHEKTGQIATYFVSSEGVLTLADSIEGRSDSLHSVRAGGHTYLIATDSVGNSVASFHVDDATGMISAIDNSDNLSSLGVSIPTDMQIVQAHGQSWVVIAGAQSNSLSVMKLNSDGSLTPTDHVLDTLHTRFGMVHDIEVVEIDGQVFVVAGGGDDGVSLFTMTPQGQLVHRDSFEHTVQTGLQNIQSLSAARVGDELQIVAASQQNAGLTQLSVDVSNIGVVRDGFGAVEGTTGDDILSGSVFSSMLTGGDGDDILIAGIGATTMTGGAGADIFVMKYGSELTTITDFQAGVDRLDMFDYLFLRSPQQLTFTPTAQGARVEYRSEVVELQSQSGTPLTLEQTFGAGFGGPDHIPVDFGDFGGLDPGSSDGVQGLVSINSETANEGLTDAEISFALDGGGTVSVRADDEGRFDLGLPSGSFTGELDIIKTYSTASRDVTAFDALQALRISVGLDPTWGPASPENLIAADINQDGRVNALDALMILQTSVGLTPEHSPEWVFLDEEADLSGITYRNVAYETGRDVTIADNVLTTDMTSILLGNLEPV